MRTVCIWVSSLLASTIPFIFVGAVIAFGACVFDAGGEHAPPARSGASLKPEARPPEQALALASADAAQRKPSKRQPAKHARGDAPHHHAGPPRQSRPYSRVRPSPFEFDWGFANHFAKPNYPARPLANLQ